MTRSLASFALLALALAGCGRTGDDSADLNQLDRELSNANAASPARDPALTAALQDQIMVDPALAQQSNAGAVRPPTRPYAAPIPADDIAVRGDATANASATTEPAAATASTTLAAIAGRRPEGRSCAQRVRYSAGWANRLPPELPLHPGARVIEAAGTDEQGCSLRVVNFAATAAPAEVIGWYRARARAAGYSAEARRDGGQDVLGGTRGDGAAFITFVSPRRGGGSDVDLVTSARP